MREHDPNCYAAALDPDSACDCGAGYYNAGFNAGVEACAKEAETYIEGLWTPEWIAADLRKFKCPTPEPKSCAAGHAREVKSIGFLINPHGTGEQAYTAWARERGINPWCGRALKECPETK